MNSAGQQNTRFTIQKSVAFLYSKNEISERESKKKKNFFLNHLKNKILWNKSDQGGRRLIP